MFNSMIIGMYVQDKPLKIQSTILLSMPNFGHQFQIESQIIYLLMQTRLDGLSIFVLKNKITMFKKKL